MDFSKNTIKHNFTSQLATVVIEDVRCIHNRRWPEKFETFKYLPNSLKMTAHLLFYYNFTVGVQNTYKRPYSLYKSIFVNNLYQYNSKASSQQRAF